MAQCELRGLLGWLVVGRSAACVDSGGSVLRTDWWGHDNQRTPQPTSP